MIDKTKQTVYWSFFEYNNWRFYVAATPKGLCYIGSPNKPFEELHAWAAKKFRLLELKENPAALQPYTQEIIEYFQGSQQSFTFPIDLQGTPFQHEVWKALNQIPYGSTCTYSQIAATIQKPKAVRAVGTAIGANPVLISIPCHRVIGKNGTLTGYRGGLEMKQYLLQLETASQCN